MAHHSLDVVAHEADITAQRYEAGAATRDYDVERAQALVAQVACEYSDRSRVSAAPRSSS